jgi:hypothetical protein
MKIGLFVLLLVSSFIGFTQDHFNLQINEKGLLRIFQLAIKYNTAGKSQKSVTIPADLYEFTIKKKDLLSNPIVPILNEISDINLNKDLNFYFSSSSIQIEGNVDQKSLRSQILNSGPQSFDVILSLNLSEIKISAKSMSLCEDKVKKNCGKGLKTVVRDIKINTFKRPVSISAHARVTLKDGLARLKIVDVSTNLEGKNSPSLNINFGSLEVPQISIVIDGQETVLDTSKLREEVLARKNYLSKKLLGFAAEFIASDVVEMINMYLINKSFSTSFEVYRRYNPNATFDEFLAHAQSADFSEAPYIRPALNLNTADVTGVYQQDHHSRAFPRDNTYVKPPVMVHAIKKPEVDYVKILSDQISEIIKQAKVDISIKRVSTPGDKDLQLSAMLGFVLNNQKVNVINTISNSAVKLPLLVPENLAAVKPDLRLTISEPVINGSLNLINSTGLFSEFLDKATEIPGFSLKSVKLHFTKSNSLSLIINANLDLRKLRASFLNNPQKWIKNKLAAWLERNNNNSVIYFPIEIEVQPAIKNSNGIAKLDLFVNSPFKEGALRNTFNYPSNVDKMTNTVREGVLEELKGSLAEMTDKNYTLDIDKYLNQSGVLFVPRHISFTQSAYLNLYLDIVDIKFNNKTPVRK